MKIASTAFFLVLALSCRAVDQPKWLSDGDVDRVAREVSKITFPITVDAALAVIGPVATQKTLPRMVANSGPKWPDKPYYMSVDLTSYFDPRGHFILRIYFTKKKAGAAFSDAPVVIKMDVEFLMPRGPVDEFGLCERGWRSLTLEAQEPNQPSEPTPPSVTPPAAAGAAPDGGVAHL